MCLQEMSKMDKIGSPRKWNKDYSFGDIDYKKVLDDIYPKLIQKENA